MRFTAKQSIGRLLGGIALLGGLSAFALSPSAALANTTYTDHTSGDVTVSGISNNAATPDEGDYQFKIHNTAGKTVTGVRVTAPAAAANLVWCANTSPTSTTVCNITVSIASGGSTVVAGGGDVVTNPTTCASGNWTVLLTYADASTTTVTLPYDDSYATINGACPSPSPSPSASPTPSPTPPPAGTTPSDALTDFMGIFQTICIGFAALIVPFFVLTWVIRLVAKMVKGE